MDPNILEDRSTHVLEGKHIDMLILINGFAQGLNHLGLQGLPLGRGLRE
jgi:hypothetical protein